MTRFETQLGVEQKSTVLNLSFIYKMSMRSILPSAILPYLADQATEASPTDVSLAVAAINTAPPNEYRRLKKI
jgi:hypothetical protein